MTGASSGIGRAIAIQLAISGLNLVLVARSQSTLEQLEQELTQQYGIKVRTIGLDLAEPTGAESLVAAIQDLEVGLLVAAAGFGTSGLFLNASLGREIEMLHLNCRSLMALCWHFGQRFAQQRSGGLVLMSSIVGFQGMPYAAHYAATKAYVQALAEALHVELAPLGIDVIASAPGPTRSNFAERAGMNMGKALDPELVARETLQALGRQSVVLPGWLSKLLTYSLVPLPRWARVRIMGGVMQGMTKS
ncbi:SDR family NAD(P)-dependent oxidoreductase [Leptolyngbya sp. PCC 6406]|uniref:SDR family NAD(P)-dependent oxidoreductase n=1 Tax=Leptolyngbya sp. PCC 6406 TaxID=1173264 RepID=UPI00031BC497|nr:SDR family oxidoreductase [Leptolyngbya sp. PCC 6406]